MEREGLGSKLQKYFYARENHNFSPSAIYSLVMASHRRLNTAKRDEEESKKNSFQLKKEKKNFIKDPEGIQLQTTKQCSCLAGKHFFTSYSNTRGHTVNS